MFNHTINPAAQKKIAIHVQHAVRDISVLSDIEAVPEASLDTGEKLGRGGFAEVSAVSLVSAPLRHRLQEESQPQAGDHQDVENTNSASQPGDEASPSRDAESEGHERYALKRLRPDLNRGDPTRAAADILIEAALLGSVKHPNVLGIKALSGSAASNLLASFSPDQKICLSPDVKTLPYSAFYMVIDRIKETLNDRIQRWNLDNLDGSIVDNTTEEKTRIVKEVSSGLSHLHAHRIIHRDVKPDNVGFDTRTDAVKIFDLGVSRHLPSNEKEGTYKMSGQTGSQRYMAPEVMMSKPYGLSADTYSWAVLTAETFSQQRAFQGYSSQTHKHAVCYRRKRPDAQGLPKALGKLVKAAWDPKPGKRPSMGLVYEKLTQLEKSDKPTGRFFWSHRH